MNQQLPDIRGTDYGLLAYRDDYSPYLRTLQVACMRFAEAYKAVQADAASGERAFEVRALLDFTSRFAATIAALSVRLAGGHVKAPYIDITESGFPNFHEIGALESEIPTASSALATIPAQPVLKRRLIDAVMKGDASPAVELSALAERAYLELLTKPGDLFLTFSHGSLEHLGVGGDGRRQYACSWGSYDVGTNCPSIYVLQFDQSEFHRQVGSEIEQELFLEKIRAEGSHAAPLGVMATAIDEHLGIYPKKLTRWTLGPLYTPLLFEARGEGLSTTEEILKDLLSVTGREDTFLLHVTEERVEADYEAPAGSLTAALGFAKDVRQVFRIPGLDAELYERKVTSLARSTLLPHESHQHLTANLRQEIRILGTDVVLFPFNQQGETQHVERHIPKRDTD